jgi:hypothetical protein
MCEGCCFRVSRDQAVLPACDLWGIFQLDVGVVLEHLKHGFFSLHSLNVLWVWSLLRQPDICLPRESEIVLLYVPRSRNIVLLYDFLLT